MKVSTTAALKADSTGATRAASMAVSTAGPKGGSRAASRVAQMAVLKAAV